MKGERLQMRISSKLKEQAERLAARRHTSLTALVMELLAREVQADQYTRSSRTVDEVPQI